MLLPLFFRQMAITQPANIVDGVLIPRENRYRCKTIKNVNSLVAAVYILRDFPSFYGQNELEFS
jgi:hypothetical protein